MRSVIGAMVVLTAGCATHVEGRRVECDAIGAEDVVALLGVPKLPTACGFESPTHVDVGNWRLVNASENLATGAAVCVYRATFLVVFDTELVLVDGVPSEATLASRGTDADCIVDVPEVCLPSGECTIID